MIVIGVKGIVVVAVPIVQWRDAVGGGLDGNALRVPISKGGGPADASTETNEGRHVEDNEGRKAMREIVLREK